MTVGEAQEHLWSAYPDQELCPCAAPGGLRRHRPRAASERCQRPPKQVDLISTQKCHAQKCHGSALEQRQVISALDRIHAIVQKKKGGDPSFFATGRLLCNIRQNEHAGARRDGCACALTGGTVLARPLGISVHDAHARVLVKPVSTCQHVQRVTTPRNSRQCPRGGGGGGRGRSSPRTFLAFLCEK